MYKVNLADRMLDKISYEVNLYHTEIEDLNPVLRGCWVDSSSWINGLEQC
jgi:hypothetical protein